MHYLASKLIQLGITVIELYSILREAGAALIHMIDERVFYKMNNLNDGELLGAMKYSDLYKSANLTMYDVHIQTLR